MFSLYRKHFASQVSADQQLNLLNTRHSTGLSLNAIHAQFQPDSSDKLRPLENVLSGRASPISSRHASVLAIHGNSSPNHQDLPANMVPGLVPRRKPPAPPMDDSCRKRVDGAIERLQWSRSLGACTAAAMPSMDNVDTHLTGDESCCATTSCDSFSFQQFQHHLQLRQSSQTRAKPQSRSNLRTSLDNHSKNTARTVESHSPHRIGECNTGENCSGGNTVHLPCSPCGNEPISVGCTPQVSCSVAARHLYRHNSTSAYDSSLQPGAIAANHKLAQSVAENLNRAHCSPSAGTATVNHPSTLCFSPNNRKQVDHSGTVKQTVLNSGHLLSPLSSALSFHRNHSASALNLNSPTAFVPSALHSSHHNLAFASHQSDVRLCSPNSVRQAAQKYLQSCMQPHLKPTRKTVKPTVEPLINEQPFGSSSTSSPQASMQSPHSDASKHHSTPRPPSSKQSSSLKSSQSVDHCSSNIVPSKPSPLIHSHSHHTSNLHKLHQYQCTIDEDDLDVVTLVSSSHSPVGPHYLGSKVSCKGIMWFACCTCV